VLNNLFAFKKYFCVPLLFCVFTLLVFLAVKCLFFLNNDGSSGIARYLDAVQNDVIYDDNHVVVGINFNHLVFSDFLVNEIVREKSIHTIYMYKCVVREKQFLKLIGSLKIQYLSVPGCAIDNSCRNHLLLSKDLVLLNVSESGCTGEDIVKLSEIKSLKSLIANGILISDVELKTIANKRSDLSVLTDIGCIENGEITLWKGEAERGHSK
jgi:hypothetical protein